ncbi:hypothetical protein Gotri_026518 [Gossypium trilobum]|uniref:Ribosomal protein S11 n=1 Tax=Gossypium trilobum TaxID=34281 RepID=A0A7J9FVM3_9ROSI|nr:hypothetical protein [Gossypium trilobum]
MAKPIPKVGSRRNERNSAQKSARIIPKGVIHVQASFNNTIVTIADVRGRVISWSSVGTCGIKGTRRGTPYSSNSRPRYATSRSYDKRSWSRKRSNITSYS